MSSKKSLGLK